MESQQYNEVSEILAYDPEPLGFDKEQVIRDTYEHLCEEVEAGYLTVEEASRIYDQWRVDWGLD